MLALERPLSLFLYVLEGYGPVWTWLAVEKIYGIIRTQERVLESELLKVYCIFLLNMLCMESLCVRCI